MKATLLILALAAIPLAAFGQGKVLFGNNDYRLIVVDGLWQPVPQVGSAYYVMSNLTAQLWGGTTSNALTLQAQVSPAGAVGLGDGLLRNTAVTLNGILPGNAFFQILIFETSAGSYANALTGFGYWRAATPVFQAAVGSFAPAPLVSSPNWAPGPITLSMGLDFPPPPPPTLLALGQIGNQFRFSFVAQAYRDYAVEYCDSLIATNWATLTNIQAQSTPTTLLISDTITAQERYFRVRTP